MSPNKRKFDGNDASAARKAGTEQYLALKFRYSGVVTSLDRIVRDGSAMLKSCDAFDDSISGLLETARQAGVFRASERQKIAIIGQSGSGKSALLNALTQQKTLCRSEALNEGCTSAPCELTGGDLGQTANYVVQVSFHTQESMENIVGELVDDYCLLNLNSEEIGEYNDEEKRRHKHSARTLEQLVKIVQHSAKTTFSRDLERSYNEKRLRQYKSDLVGACMEAIMRFTGSHHISMERPFESAEVVAKFIHPLGSTYEAKSGESAVWPMVKTIRICIKDCDMLQDIVLGDAPGFTDVNRIRVRNSIEYIRSCDFLLLVTTNQTRIVSDTQLDDALGDWSERFRDRIAVVVTHADEEAKPQDINRYLTSMHTEHTKQIATQYRLVSQQVMDLERDMESDSDDDEEKKLVARFNQMSRLRKLQAEESTLGIKLRTIYNKAEFLEKKGLDIPVFFVSSTHYWYHIGERNKERYTLSLPDTGIPDLRQYLVQCPRETTHRAIDQYLQYCRSFKEVLEAVLDREPPQDPLLLKQFTNEMTTAIQRHPLSKPFEDALTVHIENQLRSFADTHIARVLDYFNTISSIHPASLQAVVRKKGKHLTSSKIRYDWDQRIINLGKKEVKAAFLALGVQQSNDISELSSALRRHLEGFQSQLIGSKQKFGMRERQIEHMIATCIRLIGIHLENFAEEYNKKQRNVELDAVKGEETSFVSYAMLPLYETLETYAGKGYRERVKQRCLHAASPNGDNILKNYQTIMVSALRDVQSKMTAKLDEKINEAVQNLCAKLNDNVMSSEDLARARTAASEYLVETESKLQKLGLIMQGLGRDVSVASAQANNDVEMSGTADRAVDAAALQGPAASAASQSLFVEDDGLLGVADEGYHE
ncbi:Brefeldin A resistance protein [Sphaceloma murrayae]|uniref:Brefeldin A resistance protein n=1 Tax=Sphaceloma murrayae TaxID=2082308 RepID=A0A2K1QH43_9PEZI|nr:Brefeldin A resistance protein [Sphaceloma murrayae]